MLPQIRMSIASNILTSNKLETTLFFLISMTFLCIIPYLYVMEETIVSYFYAYAYSFKKFLFVYLFAHLLTFQSNFLEEY